MRLHDRQRLEGDVLYETRKTANPTGYGLGGHYSLNLAKRVVVLSVVSRSFCLFALPDGTQQSEPDESACQALIFSCQTQA